MSKFDPDDDKSPERQIGEYLCGKIISEMEDKGPMVLEEITGQIDNTGQKKVLEHVLYLMKEGHVKPVGRDKYHHTDGAPTFADKILDRTEEDFDWPLYFASGVMKNPPEQWVPSYYKVEGPNGPVSYMNPNSKVYPTTMIDLIFEGMNNNHFEEVFIEDTPFEPEND